MKIPHTLFATALAVGTSHGATLLHADFDSYNIDPGNPVTQSSLNEVTTGATWNLNTGRGTAFTIEEASGDQALLFDDTDGGNCNVKRFSTLTLNTTADFTANPLSITFNTAPRRSGNNKYLLYEFLDSSGNVGASIRWTHGGDVLFNESVDGTQAFTQITSWDPGSAAMATVTFSASTVSLSLGDASSGEIAFQDLATSNFSAFRFSSYAPGGVQNVGGYLDDITIERIPEPTGALLGGLGGLLLLRRRRA